MDECKVKVAVTGNGISRNGRRYDLKAVQEAFDSYIEDHRKEIIDGINDFYIYGDDKKLNNLGVYAFPRYGNGWYLIGLGVFTPKELIDVYREFIEENKYGRITNPDGSLSIPRIKCSKNNGNNIKYDSRKLFDDLGK